MENKRIKRAVNEIILLSHAEFISASSTHVVELWKQQRQALKILNQVQNDTLFNNSGFTRPSLVTPQGFYAGYSEGKQGFTLIELLVVVLIIGILAAVALPQYNLAVAKSRYTQLLTAGNALRTAIQTYQLENNAFPSTFEDLDFLPFNGTLTEDKRKLKSGSLGCYFNGEYKELVCLDAGKDLPYLLVYKEGGVWKRECRAHNDFQKKVCLGMNAIYSNTSTDFTNYTLP